MQKEREPTKPLAVRIPETLHEAASDVSRLVGISVREMVQRGLERELSDRIKKGGEPLKEMLQRMRDFRQPSQPA